MADKQNEITVLKKPKPFWHRVGSLLKTFGIGVGVAIAIAEHKL